MKKNYFLIAAVLAAYSVTLNAQVDNIKPVSKKAQFTFFYPVGSYGLNSIDNRYDFSLNTIYGVTGGSNYFELASVGNLDYGNVGGFQIAGVCNLVQGNQSGCQIGGVFNQTTGSSSGTVISGVLNVTAGETKGMMLSGVVNYSGRMRGFQLSTVNIASKYLSGCQIGVLNIAQEGKGFQFGIVNVAKGSDNSILPVGLVNIVKNGYYAFELSGDEMLYTRLSYKMGMEKLYTVYNIGTGRHNHDNFYSFGCGFGTDIGIGKRQCINLELTGTQFYKDDFKSLSEELSQLSVSYEYGITNHMALKLGPSFNCFVAKKNAEKAISVPYKIFSDKGNSHETSFWIGVNAGFVVRL